MANTADYSIDYEDERFQKIEDDYQKDSAELNDTYNGIINNTDGFYSDLKEAMQQQTDQMAQIQQDNTDFAIEKIEQQKEQAEKDYIKEQSGAYVDWRKQSNQYGAEAEKMASAGLANTGYSESSQVSMYNTYQNRVATAREVLSQAKLSYDNMMKEAILQNNAALAEIYSNNMIKQAELALEGFQYKNQLVLELATKKTELNNMKWQKEMALLDQMNTENALKWDIDSYYDNQAWQTEQAELDREHQTELADLNHKHQLERDKINNDFAAKEAELDRKFQEKLEGIRDKNEKERLKIQHQNDLDKLKKQQEYALAQLDKELANDKALLQYEKSISQTKITGGGSGGGSSTKSSGSKKTISGGTKVTTSSKNENTNTQPTVDMKSVLALGYGPISTTRLNELVQQGVVQEYVEGGKIKFRKVVKKYGF